MFKWFRHSVLLVLAVALCALSTPGGAAVAMPSPTTASFHSADGQSAHSGKLAKRTWGECIVHANDPYQATHFEGGVPQYNYVAGIVNVDCVSDGPYAVNMYAAIQKRVKVNGVWKWVQQGGWSVGSTTGPHATVSKAMRCSVLGHGDFRLAGHIAVISPVDETADDQSNATDGLC